MGSTISKYDDIIDSRDIIERIDELQDDDERDEGASEELRELLELQDDCAGYCEDWEYGATLIRDSYFVEYAQQFAEDCCEIPSGNRWPMYCIDWEWAARELQIDYTSVNFGGVEYWVR